jgi:hypothetical protein
MMNGLQGMHITIFIFILTVIKSCLPAENSHNNRYTPALKSCNEGLSWPTTRHHHPSTRPECRLPAVRETHVRGLLPRIAGAMHCTHSDLDRRWLHSRLRGAGSSFLESEEESEHDGDSEEGPAPDHQSDKGPVRDRGEDDDGYVSPDDSFAGCQSISAEGEDAVPPDMERPSEVRACEKVYAFSKYDVSPNM